MCVKQAAAWGLIAAVAAVGGCSGDDDAASNGGDLVAEDPAPPVDSCDLVTVDEVSGLIGAAVTMGPDGNGGTCRWMADTANGIGIIPGQHWVELTTLEPPVSTLEAMLHGVDGEPEPVTDLGDEAQLVLNDSTAVSPAVIAGYIDDDRIVTLKYEVQLTDAEVDLQPHADVLIDLLRRVERRASAN